jgi:hypothetical protein
MHYMLSPLACNAEWSLSFQLNKLKRTILYSTKELAKPATTERLSQQTAHSIHTVYDVAAVPECEIAVYHSDDDRMTERSAFEFRCSDDQSSSYTAAVHCVGNDKKSV